MSIELGEVVRFKRAGPKGERGRVCKDNGLSVCVNFKSSGCLRALKDDLEPTDGRAPECSDSCGKDC